jgi:hypothetical protein
MRDRFMRTSSFLDRAATERLRVDAAGDLLIDTPAAPSARSAVNAPRDFCSASMIVQVRNSDGTLSNEFAFTRGGD